MRAVVWISESSWRAAVDAARALLPPDAEITLLHVSDRDVDQLADHAAVGLMGRRHPRPPGLTAREVGEAEAHALLEAATERLGRPARALARRGRVEREVLQAAADADVLMLVRDGEPRRGPKSFGKRARFITDHAGCAVLLAWAERPPGLETMPWPPHLR